MSYNYHAEKYFVFTDDGQRMFLKIRDKVKELHEFSGAFTLSNMISGFTGDSFSMLACVDRLVELGEIELCWSKGASQDHIYRKVKK